MFIKLLAPYWEPESVQQALNNSALDKKAKIYVTSVIQQQVEEWFRSDVDSLGENLANMPWFNSVPEDRDIFVHNREGLKVWEEKVKEQITSDLAAFVKDLVMGENFRDLTVTDVVTEILEFMAKDMTNPVTPTTSTESVPTLGSDFSSPPSTIADPVLTLGSEFSTSESNIAEPTEQLATPSLPQEPKITPKIGKTPEQLVKKVKSDLKKLKKETNAEVSKLAKQVTDLNQTVDAVKKDTTTENERDEKLAKWEDFATFIEWREIEGTTLTLLTHFG